jgi:hypothetical protein
MCLSSRCSDHSGATSSLLHWTQVIANLERCSEIIRIVKLSAFLKSLLSQRGNGRLIDLVQESDRSFKTAAAYRAVPNMTGVAVAQVLGPVGRNQLSAALNAVHPEGGAKIGYYHQLNLTAFSVAKMQRRVIGIMAVDSL